MFNNEVYPSVTSGHVMRTIEKFEPRRHFPSGRVTKLVAKFEEYKHSTTAHMSRKPKSRGFIAASGSRATHDSGNCMHVENGDGRYRNNGPVQTLVIDEDVPHCPKRAMSVELVGFQCRMLVGLRKTAADDNVSHMCLLPLNSSGATNGSGHVPESGMIVFISSINQNSKKYIQFNSKFVFLDNILTQPRYTCTQKDIYCSNIDTDNSRETDAPKSSNTVLMEKIEDHPSPVCGNVQKLIERFNAM